METNDNQPTDKTEIAPEVYNIAGVENTVKEIQNKLLKISYDVLARINRKEPVPPEVFEEQGMYKQQLTIWTKTLSDMKKAAPKGEDNSMQMLFNQMESIKLGVGEIKQKISQ